MDDLLQEFLEETNEALQKLELQFIELEKTGGDADSVNNIFRVMHTIKGTSGFLAFKKLEKVAHSAENIMDKVRSNKLSVNQTLISLVLEAGDAVKSIVENLGNDGTEGDVDYSDLIIRLDECASGKVAVAEKKEESKTPDLDEEIDFTPIMAEYADTEKSAENKTPDLDEPIDFTPIMADYASNSPTPKTPNKTEEIKQVINKPAPQKQEKKEEPKNNDNKKAAQQSIRVNIDILENMMQLVGELVLTRNQIQQLRRSSSVKLDPSFVGSFQRLNIITSELQEGVMKTRMQAVSSVWQLFPRIIRDLANDLGKKIELKMIGEETELDRQMLETIKDPLTHMIRNSADHGIEKPAERLANGKSETGTITLSAYHEGGQIIIKISDDGKGVNINAVKKRAIEKGLATEDEIARMSDNQICHFIFKPGFSTAEQVTAVSGRGVGMDVVISNINKIGGSLEIENFPGKGAEFLIKLPLTLAIMPVLLVQAKTETFAIPQILVSEIVRVGKTKRSEFLGDAKYGEIKIHSAEVINGKPVLRLRGRIIPIISLPKELGLCDEKYANDNEIERFVVICEVGSNIFGISVDKVFHTEEIVVKPKSPLIKDLEYYSGSTILGDGSVILIVDLIGLLRNSGVEATSGQNKQKQVKKIFDEEEINFLLFMAGDGAPKAIPLELVSRLEELDYSKIEESAGNKVIQYRDSLMRLVSIDDKVPVPEDGVRETIVFNDRDRTLGVYASEVIDIVKQRMALKAGSSKPGILGSMIINNKATEVIDISYFFSSIFTDWLGHSEANKIEGESEEGRRHILLVDDSAFFRKFMRPLILAAGYRVSTCSDGLEGLNMLKNHGEKFDLVISDIDMPVMNGVEFCKEAKKIDKLANLPFVALTSHKEEDFEEDIKIIGFERLVTKSDRNKVINLVTEILKEKKIANG
ncbi:MAG: hybrid sensor histidine kinase/response regulator [Rickettsiales bacterium]|nr:hybrid sensor histidine kinase/response regulator [Rickettsiales bacterium]